MELSNKRVITVLGVMNLALLGLGFTQWAGNWVDLRTAALKAPAPMSLPNTFTYQGKLTKADGTALPDGTDYFMDFELFDTADPATISPLCHWAVQGVVVKQGNFRAVIGSTANGSDGTCKGAMAVGNILAMYPDVYLGVKVRKGVSGTPETLEPRVSIGATPRAHHAAIAEVAKTSLDGVPVGAITAFFGGTPTVPSGWLIADGTNINKTAKPEYTSLVNHLQTLGAPYATGNPDEAKLPELRGVFLRGLDDRTTGNLNPDGPLSVGTYSADDFGAHGHTGATSSDGNHKHTGSILSAGSHSHTFAGFIDGDGAGGDIAGGPEAGYKWPFQTYSVALAGAHTHELTIDDAGSHSHSLAVDKTGGLETRPKNVTVLYLIKY